jgi:hypothetical protein
VNNMYEDNYLTEDNGIAYNDVNFECNDEDNDFTCECIWDECPLPEDYARRKCLLYKDCKAGNCD